MSQKNKVLGGYGGRAEDWGTLLEDKLTSPSKETQPDPEDYTYPWRTKGPNDS